MTNYPVDIATYVGVTSEPGGKGGVPGVAAPGGRLATGPDARVGGRRAALVPARPIGRRLARLMIGRRSDNLPNLFRCERRVGVSGGRVVVWKWMRLSGGGGGGSALGAVNRGKPLLIRLHLAKH